VARTNRPGDRRAIHVQLTARGRQQFEQMAGEHEAWIVELFAGLSAADRKSMSDLLARLRVQLAEHLSPPAIEGTKP
jgi:DNA-binding MarR family transcriptional regulator